MGGVRAGGRGGVDEGVNLAAFFPTQPFQSCPGARLHSRLFERLRERLVVLLPVPPPHRYMGGGDAVLACPLQDWRVGLVGENQGDAGAGQSTGGQGAEEGLQGGAAC